MKLFRIKSHQAEMLVPHSYYRQMFARLYFVYLETKEMSKKNEQRILTSKANKISEEIIKEREIDFRQIFEIRLRHSE